MNTFAPFSRVLLAATASRQENASTSRLCRTVDCVKTWRYYSSKGAMTGFCPQSS